MGNVTYEDLKRESPFTIKEIMEKYDVPYYRVYNIIKVHSRFFKKERAKVPKHKLGARPIIYTYIENASTFVNYYRG